MSHTAPLNKPYSVSDVDSAEDSISVAIAYDGTIEFMVTDNTNMGKVKFSSMTASQAIDFGYAVIYAAETLRDKEG